MADDDCRDAVPDSSEKLSAAAEETDASAAAPPAGPTTRIDPEFWATTSVKMPHAGKSSVHLRLDSDVLDWFRQQGRGHLTRMNAVLRSYMEAHKNR
jgi:uncharacterized protein (DUF4415 family)